MCGRGADSFTSPLPSEPRGQRCRSASLPPSKPHGGGGNPTPGEVTAGDLGGHCARWQGAAQRRTDGHAVESVTCQSFVMEKLFFFFLFLFWNALQSLRSTTNVTTQRNKRLRQTLRRWGIKWGHARRSCWKAKWWTEVSHWLDLVSTLTNPPPPTFQKGLETLLYLTKIIFCHQLA